MWGLVYCRIWVVFGRSIWWDLTLNYMQHSVEHWQDIRPYVRMNPQRFL